MYYAPVDENTNHGAHMANAHANEYLTRDEAAEYLRVSPRTISDWQARRLIPYIKTGRRCVRYRRQDLDAAMGKFTIR